MHGSVVSGAAREGVERAICDGDVAFVFPEGEAGVRDVPEAEELGGCWGEEGGWGGGWGADEDGGWGGEWGLGLGSHFFLVYFLEAGGGGEGVDVDVGGDLGIGSEKSGVVCSWSRNRTEYGRYLGSSLSPTTM